VKEKIWFIEIDEPYVFHRTREPITVVQSAAIDKINHVKSSTVNVLPYAVVMIATLSP
jgi:hypothetical protein